MSRTERNTMRVLKGVNARGRALLNAADAGDPVDTVRELAAMGADLVEVGVVAAGAIARVERLEANAERKRPPSVYRALEAINCNVGASIVVDHEAGTVRLWEDAEPGAGECMADTTNGGCRCCNWTGVILKDGISQPCHCLEGLR